MYLLLLIQLVSFVTVLPSFAINFSDCEEVHKQALREKIDYNDWYKIRELDEKDLIKHQLELGSNELGGTFFVRGNTPNENIESGNFTLLYYNPKTAALAADKVRPLQFADFGKMEFTIPVTKSIMSTYPFFHRVELSNGKKACALRLLNWQKPKNQ